MTPNPVPTFTPPPVVSRLEASDMVGLFLPDLVRTVSVLQALSSIGAIEPDQGRAVAAYLTGIPGDLGITADEVLDQATGIWTGATAAIERLGYDLALDEAADHADPE